MSQSSLGKGQVPWAASALLPMGGPGAGHLGSLGLLPEMEQGSLVLSQEGSSILTDQLLTECVAMQGIPG